MDPKMSLIMRFQCTCIIEIEMEIHCKTIIETEFKCIANNGIEIETEIHLITDTTLVCEIKFSVKGFARCKF